MAFKPGARNEKSCLRSVNLTCGDLTCTEKGWDWGNQLLTDGFMYILALFPGGGGGGSGATGIAVGM